MENNYISHLNINEFVIHLKHGVGQYQGLIIIENNGIKAEYIIILYANELKIYVPIIHLYLIKSYRTISNNKKIQLHKFNCKKWQIEQKKIFKNIQNHAIKLLNAHAIRIARLGFSFKINDKEYDLFCKSFPFQMTKDQESVMNTVLSDMKKKNPMDRLICGDVGFGKTEIAMRAAFIAVKNKKQVMILVPTTLLSQQHYINFVNRFVNFSIKINILYRFTIIEKQKKCIKKLQKGKIDILIGTHKTLSDRLKWFDLGLLIIDEEHRFGVCQKEKIKKKFCHIDILTLTATPIPRTLNMAMYGIRDLSIISIPPKNRLPIKTFVKEYNTILIKKIILKELSRNGQIYYVYNKVKNLEKKLIELKKIVPQARFNIGHGKMNGNNLKKIMNDFYNKKFDILICTTIIETGIDIPTVNLIIIENANDFGLAQLHQMRGRVGRSNIQGYAWLLVKNFNNLSLNGKKRLKVIESMNHFGSGFELSMHDLNMRGMGELLGYNQSGHINNIEFTLYMELLEKAIKLTKQNRTLSLTELQYNQPNIKLFIPIFFPDIYISNIKIKLYFYKKIFSVKTKNDLLKIKLHLINKFGPLPIETKNLFFIAYIKIISYQIGIIDIQCNKYGGIIKFSKHHNIYDINYLINICKKKPEIWKLNNTYSLKFVYNLSNHQVRINWILNFLKKIQKKCHLL